jgi:chaperone required for assembly of F1-ATPase
VKRVYEKAAVADVEGGWAITLDGRPLRPPLVLPTRALAAAVAGEWNAQGEAMEPATMPLTRLASTARDRVEGNREAVIDEISAYGASDLLCYRAEHPQALVRRQAETWQPLLDWAARRYDAPLVVTGGVLPVTQNPQSLAALRAAVAAYDAFALAGLHAATTASGSLILALALATGQLDAAAVAAASQLDESYQAEKWGQDAEAEERLASLRAQLSDAEKFLGLLAAKA